MTTDPITDIIQRLEKNKADLTKRIKQLKHKLEIEKLAARAASDYASELESLLNASRFMASGWKRAAVKARRVE